ncbi:MAG: MaoC family dehydratase N-terminal domain-containing protein [Candidatus Nanopelagicales bacterium]
MVLLTDELRARIGETRVYVAPEALSRASIRYYAVAVGDDNALYTDTDAARAAGLLDVMAPPTLLADTNQYLLGERDTDGFAGHSWGLDVPNSRTVRGGNDYIFHRPAHPDDVVTVTWRLIDMAERTTSGGMAMMIVTSRAEFTDQRGEPVLSNTETIIYTELPGAAT